MTTIESAHIPGASFAPVSPSVPDVSVVIVTWNSGAVLTRCLHAVHAELATLAGECIVVDNASDDAADLDKLTARPTVRVVRNRRNRGFAAAVNQALASCRGRHVLLLNPDAFVRPGTLRHLVSVLDAEPALGIIGPRILDPNGNVQGSARAFPGPLTALFGRTSFLTQVLPRNPLSARNMPALAGPRTEPLTVDWVSGACMLIRGEALRAVGTLDERFFMYWEDADLCWRVRRAGWQVMYDPRVEVEHVVGASSSAAPVRSTIAFHVSAYRIYRKHVTRHVWHPLSLGAAAALGVRAAVLAPARWWVCRRGRRPGA